LRGHNEDDTGTRDHSSLASNPISLVAADIHLGLGQRPHRRPAKETLIQNMCQLGTIQKGVFYQSVTPFAAHELDRHSCHLKRHQLKRYAGNRNAWDQRDGLAAALEQASWDLE